MKTMKKKTSIGRKKKAILKSGFIKKKAHVSSRNKINQAKRDKKGGK